MAESTPHSRMRGEMAEVDTMVLVGQELARWATKAEQEGKYEEARVVRALESHLMSSLQAMLVGE